MKWLKSLLFMLVLLDILNWEEDQNRIYVIILR